MPDITPSALSKDDALQRFAEAYEGVITAATAAERGWDAQGRAVGWGPREVVAHLAGWEVMASVRVPHVVAGMPPIELADEAQAEVMNDAINATIVAMVGDQPLATICDLLRRVYTRNVTYLRTLDNAHFQPGAYVYERTVGVIEHCAEHGALFTAGGADGPGEGGAG